MVVRSLVIAVGLVCLLGVLWVAQNPPMELSESRLCPLLGLAWLGLATVRSEGLRRPAQQYAAIASADA